MRRRVGFLTPCRFVCATSSPVGQKANYTTRPASQFPYGLGSFEKVFAPARGFWYVDRTDFIPQLEALPASAVVSLKNRRMGKTLWKDTLVHYYDVAQRDRFKEHFGHLAIGKAPTRLANTFHVLPITFAGLTTDTVEEFKTSLNDTLNDSFEKFKKRYSLSFEKNEQNALSTFQRLVDEVQTKNEKLYVVIDEYDVSINKALGNRDFVSALRVLEGESRNPLKRMENIYAEFFSRIKTACDDNVARCFITGVTPLALNEFTSGFNIAIHITNDLRFASLYGFTETDVRSGLARFPQLKPEVIDGIVGSWRRDHNGYYFDPRQKVALYNPTRVLYGLYRLEEILQIDPPPSGLQPKEVTDYLLSRIRKDRNSLPAEATLAAIKSNPNASLVVAEALSADNAELACPGGVEEQFRLSHMNELAANRKPLLSFMFYTGALTYVPMATSEVKLKHSLRIPNNVAREEFAVELQRMIGLDASGYNSLRSAIVTMLDQKEIDSFCTVVSRFLLSGLDGRDVLGGEDPFAQAIYDALSLARRPGDCVKKEYKVDPKVRAEEMSGPAIDIAYITQVPQPQQCYCFSLKNVPLRGLDNWKTESTWETMVKISRNQIDDEDPSTVLKLRLADRFSDNNKLPRGATVQTVLDEAVKEARTKYLPPLRTDVGEANVYCWVLVRVGLGKLLWEKVV